MLTDERTDRHEESNNSFFFRNLEQAPKKNRKQINYFIASTGSAANLLWLGPCLSFTNGSTGTIATILVRDPRSTVIPYDIKYFGPPHCCVFLAITLLSTDRQRRRTNK